MVFACSTDEKPIENYNELCFLAPVLVASSCSDNEEWHNSVRNAVIEYGDHVYFGETIKMLCLLIDNGGWIVPVAESAGEYNLPDVLPAFCKGDFAGMAFIHTRLIRKMAYGNGKVCDFIKICDK